MVRRSRRGFTLIELLIVIGILLLLLGIGTIGYMHIDKVAAEKATHARLDTCTSILNEYETAGIGMTAVEAYAGQLAYYPTPPTPPPGIIAVYSSTVPTLPSVASPGDVNVGSPGRSAVTVTATGVTLYTMSHVPGVKALLAQTPQSALLPAVITSPYGLTPATIQTQCLVDGWKNPIIYVPTGGLTGVTITQGVTSAGVPNVVTVTVTSKDGRPFWASAGQDGNFTNGDDNVYSTAVQYTVAGSSTHL